MKGLRCKLILFSCFLFKSLARLQQSRKRRLPRTTGRRCCRQPAPPTLRGSATCHKSCASPRRAATAPRCWRASANPASTTWTASGSWPGHQQRAVLQRSKRSTQRWRRRVRWAKCKSRVTRGRGICHRIWSLLSRRNLHRSTRIGVFSKLQGLNSVIPFTPVHQFSCAVVCTSGKKFGTQVWLLEMCFIKKRDFVAFYSDFINPSLLI